MNQFPQGDTSDNLSPVTTQLMIFYRWCCKDISLPTLQNEHKVKNYYMLSVNSNLTASQTKKKKTSCHPFITDS
jgi:hypothetical protein